ncbi:MAG: hypothetical protein GY842_00885 [bacterium]|nr:hypothetical protein [bacterium]
MGTPVALGLVLLSASLTPVPAASAGEPRGVDRGRGLIFNVTQGTPHTTIQEAIVAAVGGDEIEVGPGTYVERIDLLGKAITLRGTGGPAATIINGDAGGSVITCASGEELSTAIEGFTITNGYADNGGGMYNSGSSPTLTDCTFSGNVATDEYPNGGGGMYNISSSPTLIDCTFTGNTGGDGGGGMFNSGSSPTLTNCTFSGNSAVYGGGGMENEYSSSPTLTDCTFSENTGGGMRNIDGSSPTLTNCTFSGNSAEFTSGGMENILSSPTLTNCTFSGNSALAYGGGMENYTSSPTLMNCTFSGNSALYGGGGLFNYNTSSPTLTNCIFSGNSAQGGGGMRNEIGSSPTLTNSTFSGNSAESYCGGMSSSDGSSPTLTNCIVWDNPAPNGLEVCDYDSSTTTATYSCLTSVWPGTGNIDGDPTFARPPDDGGDGWGDDPSTPTIDEGANDDYGDLRLQTASPCIDAADSTAVPADVSDVDGDDDRTEPCPLDLGGLPRFHDDPATPNSGVPGPLGPVVDMGAYEYGATDCNDNAVDDQMDLLDETSTDCNTNNIPDECDMAVGTSADCNTNGTPDECDLAAGTSMDCNTNNIPDECDVAETDCNSNSVPDKCDVLGGHDCCQASEVPGCSNPAIRDCVCAVLPYCCETAWDTYCVDEVGDEGCFDCELENDCNANDIPDTCDVIDAGDFDVDGDSDLSDYRWLADCMAGPDQPPYSPAPECVEAHLAAFDFDSDGDVDLNDVNLFERQLTSPW